MLGLIKKNRCSVCRSERSLRACPRNRKDIGWTCCNELRIDAKCPDSCQYAPKTGNEDGSPFPAFRSDSNTEYTHCVKLYIDLWIKRPMELFDGFSPSALATQDTSRLLAWLSGFQYPANFPMAYLLEKLGLESDVGEKAASYEDTALAFMDTVIAQDWSELRRFTVCDAEIPDLATRYAELISVNSDFKRIKSYRILHSGIADDGVTAMVFLEVNEKSDWTIILTSVNGKWQIRQNLNGNPKLYYDQNALHQQIAQNLGEGKDDAAWQLIRDNIKHYPDSADLRYYLGMYWQLVRQTDKVKVELFNSVALDNWFYAAAFTLGVVYLSENNPQEAKIWFQHLRVAFPEDPNVLNNLGGCYAGLGDLDAARVLWNQTLKHQPDNEMAAKNLERYRDKA